jgi:hypothetical protein
MTLVFPDAVPVVKTVVLPLSTVVEPEIASTMGMVAWVELMTTGVPDMVVVKPGRVGVAGLVVGRRAIVVGAVMTTTGVREMVVVTPEMGVERPAREERGIVVGPEIIITGVPEMVAVPPGIITGGALFVGTATVACAEEGLPGVAGIELAEPSRTEMARLAGTELDAGGTEEPAGTAGLELKKPPAETVMTVEVVKSGARPWVVGSA